MCVCVCVCVAGERRGAWQRWTWSIGRVFYGLTCHSGLLRPFYYYLRTERQPLLYTLFTFCNLFPCRFCFILCGWTEHRTFLRGATDCVINMACFINEFETMNRFFSASSYIYIYIYMFFNQHTRFVCVDRGAWLLVEFWQSVWDWTTRYHLFCKNFNVDFDCACWCVLLLSGVLFLKWIRIRMRRANAKLSYIYVLVRVIGRVWRHMWSSSQHSAAWFARARLDSIWTRHCGNILFYFLLARLRFTLLVCCWNN